ncbi:MAG TPA: type II toxin-antitoxin system VapC family toxin [Candidatus Binataceae bacterium]|nr:type II toxin-antitoxin system VapC family toxin [Candidatus Binataceae bacterium]
MVAVDTNVVVRLLTGDDPAQAARAHALFEREAVLLGKTMMLESEWVLRRLYGFGSERIADAFAALMGLPEVTCEDSPALADAIRWMRAGMDFADALHLASAQPAGRFATFDGKLARRAAKVADVAIIRP